VQHKFIDKCKGTALFLKRRIDQAKALREDAKKQRLAAAEAAAAAAAEEVRRTVLQRR